MIRNIVDENFEKRFKIDEPVLKGMFSLPLLVTFFFFFSLFF
jgi:hypothetical protein